MWGRIRVLGLGSMNVTLEIYEVQPGRLWISEGYEVDTQKITRLRGRCRQVFWVSLPEVL